MYPLQSSENFVSQSSKHLLMKKTGKFNERGLEGSELSSRCLNVAVPPLALHQEAVLSEADKAHL